MRILRVHSWPGTGGGAEIYVSTISDLMRRRGNPTHLVLIAERPGEPDPDVTWFPTLPKGARRAASDLLGSPELLHSLRGVAAEFRPDIVHLHNYDAGFGTIRRWLAELKVPVVMTVHNAELVCPNGSLMRPGYIPCEGGILPRCQFTGCRVGWGLPYELAQRSSFDRQAAGRVRAFLCPSRALTEYVHRHRYRPAIHLASFAPIPSSVRASPTPGPPDGTPPTVGFLGRVEWYKGKEPLLQSIRILRSSIPDVRLEIAGEGEGLTHAMELSRALGVEGSVIFRGRVTGDAKEKWFRRIHVLVVPSICFDNLPFVAMEAQDRGRPVVGFGVGGIPEVVHDGEGGRIVPVADPGALASALGEILNSPEARVSMGTRGREWVLREFTPEQHLRRLDAVYEAVLAGRSLESLVEADAVPFLPNGS